MQSTLAEYQETATQDAFTLQNSKLLKVSLNQIMIQSKLGAMVAYQGDVKFEHAGTGGVGKLIKKRVTGEGTTLMKISGTGEVFLADMAQDIHLIKLENDQITCNGQNVLAFDAGIDWDIKRVEGAGRLAGGLFNVVLEGTGKVAVTSDGEPVLLDTSTPTFADPESAIAWSGGVRTGVRSDVSFKTFTGRGSGESFQVSFEGDGWVLIQPSEGPTIPEHSHAGEGGGSLGSFFED